MLTLCGPGSPFASSWWFAVVVALPMLLTPAAFPHRDAAS
jgi:hypothetical protein